MKKNILFAGLILVFMAVFTSCGKKEVFSVKDCIARTIYNDHPSLYNKLPDGEEIGQLEAASEYIIVETDSMGENLHVRNADKTVDGWIYTNKVVLDKEVYSRCLKALLDGYVSAYNLVDQTSPYDLTFEEKMQSLQFIIDYYGKERFKKLNIQDEKDKILKLAFRNILPESDEIQDHKTNQIHLLADYAGKELLEWAQYRMRELYNDCIKDSQGLTCEMRAVKAENFDAIEYYYQNNILETYYAKKFNTENENELSELIVNEKDDEGHDLKYYIDECKDETIKNYLTKLRLNIPEICKKGFAAVEESKDDTRFKLIHLLYAPVPYSTYKNMNLENADSAFVYMEDGNWHKEYTSNLNLRNVPGTDSDIVGKLPFGAKVKVLQKSEEPDAIDEIEDYWYKVSADGMEGWCFGGFLVMPVKYEDLQKYSFIAARLDDSTLYDRLIQKKRDVKWLYQYEFENKHEYTAIKEAPVYLYQDTFVKVQPFDKVEVIQKIVSDDQDYLWDYGDIDSNFPKEYYNRYNYYLVKIWGDVVGVLGGSALAHDKMDVKLEALSEEEPEYDFYFTYLQDKDHWNDSIMCIYADLYEANEKDYKIRKLEYGGMDGLAFNETTLDLGYQKYKELPALTITSYTTFNTAEGRSYYSVIINVPDYSDDWTNVMYHIFTVDKKTAMAFNGTKWPGRKSYNLSNTFADSYGKFTSEPGKLPEVIFGQYGYYDDYDGGEPYQYHRITRNYLNPEDFYFESEQEEELPYLPEW